MRKPLGPILLVVFLGITFCACFYACFFTDPASLKKYKRIQIGMSLDEVQAILGPGTPVKQAEIPGYVVAVNSADGAADAAAMERERRAGLPPRTVRGNYPTRIKPVVEGDTILQWEFEPNGVRIFVAFKDGKVCEKFFWELSL